MVEFSIATTLGFVKADQKMARECHMRCIELTYKTSPNVYVIEISCSNSL